MFNRSSSVVLAANGLGLCEGRTSMHKSSNLAQCLIVVQMTSKAQKPHYCKTDVISSCDCLVGFLSGEKVNKSTIDYEVERIVNIQPAFKKYGLLNGEPQTKSQIVDGRKGYLSRFVYCPYCGEKLNWKQVLSNCL